MYDGLDAVAVDQQVCVCVFVCVCVCVCVHSSDNSTECGNTYTLLWICPL